MTNLQKYIKILESVTKKKVVLKEFVDDREDNLFTKAANKVSDTLNILLGDLQELSTLANEQEHLEDFVSEMNLYLDQTNIFQTQISDVINVANDDIDLEEAAFDQKTAGDVKMTTDELIKNKDGAVKKLDQNNFDIKLSDLREAYDIGKFVASKFINEGVELKNPFKEGSKKYSDFDLGFFENLDKHIS